jgi:hypothetical protein
MIHNISIHRPKKLNKNGQDKPYLANYNLEFYSSAQECDATKA